jgi:hypothetical protein
MCPGHRKKFSSCGARSLGGNANPAGNRAKLEISCQGQSVPFARPDTRCPVSQHHTQLLNASRILHPLLAAMGDLMTKFWSAPPVTRCVEIARCRIKHTLALCLALADMLQNSFRCYLGRVGAVSRRPARLYVCHLRQRLGLQLSAPVVEACITFFCDWGRLLFRLRPLFP